MASVATAHLYAQQYISLAWAVRSIGSLYSTHLLPNKLHVLETRNEEEDLPQGSLSAYTTLFP